MSNTKNNSMKPLKVKVNLTVDENVMEEIRLLAEKDDRSVSQYINRILKEHIKEYNCEQ